MCVINVIVYKYIINGQLHLHCYSLKYTKANISYEHHVTQTIIQLCQNTIQHIKYFPMKYLHYEYCLGKMYIYSYEFVSLDITMIYIIVLLLLARTIDLYVCVSWSRYQCFTKWKWIYTKHVYFAIDNMNHILHKNNN